MDRHHPQHSERVPTPLEMWRIEDEAGIEFADGQLVERENSARACSTAGHICYLLSTAASQTKGVKIYTGGLAYNCFSNRPHLYRKPNVSVMRVSRLREAGIVGDVPTMPIPPDLAVEVVSPRDSANALRRKFDEYRAAGFGQAWLVYPELKGVHLWRADGYAADLSAEDEIKAGPLLPAFRCRVAELFDD